jgi:hypothetical protein
MGADEIVFTLRLCFLLVTVGFARQGLCFKGADGGTDDDDDDDGGDDDDDDVDDGDGVVLVAGVFVVGIVGLLFIVDGVG